MNTHIPYDLAVTYLDGNYVWKDLAVDRHDGATSSVRSTEGEIISFDPTFWKDIPRSAHIKHLTITAHGRAILLAWPPPGMNLTATPGSAGLTLRIQLRFGRDETPASVEWDTRAEPTG
ncbi:MAG TPA: hypothetical protein VKQ36_14450 [Ktedonobacterales bacterium]|nr:hypothetical protein [Ktedonobacterales bacterium]